MQCREPGVLSPSDYYFATPSVQAKELFYYLLCAGEYQCAAGYRVKRNHYNSALLMYLAEGCCTVSFQNRIETVKQGDILLLDCYRPHEYYSDLPIKTMWVHFDGGQSLEIVRRILDTQGCVLTPQNPAYFIGAIQSILAVFRGRQTISEPSVSCILYGMLCNLISPTASAAASALEQSPLFAAVEHVRRHYSEKLTVELLAQTVAVSPAHFSRLFKKETGYAPYEYLTKVRLDQAKKLLKNTALSVSEIAEKTGFNSTSNFIYNFHGNIGISPAQFRSMPF